MICWLIVDVVSWCLFICYRCMCCRCCWCVVGFVLFLLLSLCWCFYICWLLFVAIFVWYCIDDVLLPNKTWWTWAGALSCFVSLLHWYLCLLCNVSSTLDRFPKFVTFWNWQGDVPNHNRTSGSRPLTNCGKPNWPMGVPPITPEVLQFARPFDPWAWQNRWIPFLLALCMVGRLGKYKTDRTGWRKDWLDRPARGRNGQASPETDWLGLRRWRGDWTDRLAHGLAGPREDWLARWGRGLIGQTRWRSNTWSVFVATSLNVCSLLVGICFIILFVFSLLLLCYFCFSVLFCWWFVVELMMFRWFLVNALLIWYCFVVECLLICLFFPVELLYWFDVDFCWFVLTLCWSVVDFVDLVEYVWILCWLLFNLLLIFYWLLLIDCWFLVDCVLICVGLYSLDLCWCSVECLLSVCWFFANFVLICCWCLFFIFFCWCVAEFVLMCVDCCWFVLLILCLFCLFSVDCVGDAGVDVMLMFC